MIPNPSPSAFRFRLAALTILLAGLVVMATRQSVTAATFPPDFAESLVTGGIFNPTAMTLVPDGRIFVLEKNGQVRVVSNGTLLPTPMLALDVNIQGERGLLGIALDPEFADNGHIYLYYTTDEDYTHNRISRFTVAGDVVDPGSELILLDLNPLTGGYHNGGALHFGSDGYLYAGVGENMIRPNAQSMDTLLGKLLRIGKDGSIPTDNPFYDTATGDNRAIWALGLRNPFTFAFQPGTGRLLINDVGADSWEEINDGVAGGNYGWPTCEGLCDNPDFLDPIYTYPHSQTECAITGGTFYNPATKDFPTEYVGDYFFGDYCGNWVRRLDGATGQVTDFAMEIHRPLDFDVAPDGSLYYLSRGTGEIFRVTYTGTEPPPPPPPRLNFLPVILRP